MGKIYTEYKNKNHDVSVQQYAYYITSYMYNWHTDVELLFVLDGEIEVNKSGEIYILNKGDLILVNSNIGHATMARKQNSIAMVIRFNPVYFSSWINDFAKLKFKCVSNKKNRNNLSFEKLWEAAIKMLSHIKRENEIDDIVYESFFHQLVGELVSGFSVQEASGNESRGMQNNEIVIMIIDYLNKHYTEKITLDELSSLTGYNKSYISQVIKKYLGINYYEYLTRVRLREATFALTNTDERISQIAYLHGFSDIKAFNNAFRERFQKSPSEYRKQVIKHSLTDKVGDKNYVDYSMLEDIMKDFIKTKVKEDDQDDQDDQDAVEFHQSKMLLVKELESVQAEINDISNQVNALKKKIIEF